MWYSNISVLVPNNENKILGLLATTVVLNKLFTTCNKLCTVCSMLCFNLGSQIIDKNELTVLVQLCIHGQTRCISSYSQLTLSKKVY